MWNPFKKKAAEVDVVGGTPVKSKDKPAKAAKTDPKTGLVRTKDGGWLQMSQNIASSNKCRSCGKPAKWSILRSGQPALYTCESAAHMEEAVEAVKTTAAT